ncbi:hypothetical protein H0H92_015255 [Tricholoma furcatifolium]|nr:hypothetical protein H0H92_015255 [Tricholoma furcatifolium]
MSIVYPTSGDKQEYVDTTPMPAHIPKVAELGMTSAPLKSAAFFIGAYCKEYNELTKCERIAWSRSKSTGIV